MTHWPLIQMRHAHITRSVIYGNNLSLIFDSVSRFTRHTSRAPAG